MRKAKPELRCSAEIVPHLGVLEPRTVDEHRKLRDAGHILVRDHETMSAFFWPLVVEVQERST